ncbi:C39 family peptidase [Streptomyces sp. NPDC048254]|uniref:C39 family peptidase n=1 Tax=Streptomyces sp. NPDC048254 TaxID=3365525 RepID=UPI0037228379
MTDGSVIIHPVPYFAQWASHRLVREIVTGMLQAADDPLWAEYGAETPEEYEWWSWRLCGVACLRMALKYWLNIAPTPLEVATECVEAGAYVKRVDGLDGLIYAPFAEYATSRWGICAESRPQMAAGEIPALLASGNLLMLSVHPSIREPHVVPLRKGGHLVLAVGATANHLIIHNPSGFHGVSQEFARVTWSEFDRFYADRGVVLGKPEGPS